MNLKTIAQMAGVSTATVSNVINGNFHKVSDGTREKIEEIIEKNNYQPNAVAKSLASKESRIIGLVIPNVDEEESFFANPHDAKMIALLENYIRKQGYFLMIRCVKRCRESIPLFASWNVDGLIFFGTFKSEVEDIRKDLKVPAVFFDTYPEEIQIANVGIDDCRAGFLSAEYLLEKGHRNIGFVGPNLQVPGVMSERYRGFMDACQEKGIEVPPCNVFEVDTLYRKGIAAGREIVASSSGITALSVMADTVALGLIEGLRQCAVRVPEDISIIGFDDLLEDRVSSPKLTTISQHPEKKVERAGDILFRMIRENREIVVNEMVEVEIIERQSVKELG